MSKIINAASDRHRIQLETLAEILELDEVEYTDRGTGEDYILRRNGKQVTLEVRSNRDQGGFLYIPEANLDPVELK